MLRVRGGVPRRVGIRGHKPSPAGVLELLKRPAQRARSGLALRTSKKSLALRVFRQVPRRSRTAAARDDTLGAVGASGISRACFSWPGVGAPE